MKVIDPGHIYELTELDGNSPRIQFDIPGYSDWPLNRLVFVKREGERYPGNVGHHPGTTMQEVIRALIDRLKYVDGQAWHSTNEATTHHLRQALLSLEFRAADQHGRLQDFLDRFSEDDCPELLSTCRKCLHIGCDGSCHPEVD